MAVRRSTPVLHRKAPMDAAGKLLLAILALKSPTPAVGHWDGTFTGASSDDALLQPWQVTASDAMAFVSVVHTGPASFAALQEVVLNIKLALRVAPAEYTERQQTLQKQH